MAMRTSGAAERTIVAAVALLFPTLLLAQAAAFLACHAVGRGDVPAEWVSALSLPAGLLLGRVTGLTAWLARRLPEALDQSARRHPAAACAVALFAILGLVQTGRVSAFMIDPTLARDASIPLPAGSTGHACLAAYVQAAELSRAGDPNVYARAEGRMPSRRPPHPAKP